MRRTPHFLLEDVAEVKRLIRENPWGTFVSSTSDGLVASHYPVLLEPGEEGITIVSHVGRPDEVAHELGRHELLLIVQGPHGYISPGWYDEGDIIPTWNHVTAHLYGVPEVLGEQENLAVLSRLVDEFESRMPEPRSLNLDPEYSARVAKGTVGIRLRVTRFDARLKLSQNKAPHVRERILAGLEGDGPYASQALAGEMRRLDADAAP
ncbi:FMN-binding negative transcriptional regulator [Lysobacter korlensis]|uniref:FMN-binding negative transcriptional regulator n=1 Tax=Lysobacter korlensis TaxID=553636 RepID=A0ABV6RR30_9GAMM